MDYLAGFGLAVIVSLTPYISPVIEIGHVRTPIEIKHEKLEYKPFKTASLKVALVDESKPKSSSGGIIDHAAWEKIGLCESTNNYKAINPAGYFGRWQFNQVTWDSNAAAMGRDDLVGVRPDKASPKDQDDVRTELFSRRGYQPWECAYKLGIK